MPNYNDPTSNMTSAQQNWEGEVTNAAPSTAADWNRPWTTADPRFPSSGNLTGGTGSMDHMNDMDGMNHMNGMNNMNNMNSMNSMNSMNNMSGGLRMRNNLPDEVIESPTTMNEAYLGSLKAMLRRNLGNYIVATFLIGTQSTTSWEGILYDVGNDYVTIYQPGRDRYVVTDMYSLKYMEFYDTRRRQMCDELLMQQGMGNMGTTGSMNTMNGYLAQIPRGW